MAWRNPITSLAADKITSGTFTGTYTNAGTFILAGTAGSSRIEAAGTELAFYGSDGVTKLIDLNTSSGSGAINAATITGGRVQTNATGGGIYLDGPSNRLGFGVSGSGSDATMFPALTIAAGVSTPALYLQGPPGQKVGVVLPELILGGSNSNGTGNTGAQLQGDVILLGGASSALGVDTGGVHVGAQRYGNLTYAELLGSDNADWGVGSINAATLDGNAGSGAVTFGKTLPAAPSFCMIAPRSGFSQYVVTAGTITTTGFHFRTWGSTGVVTTNGTALAFHWLAIV